MPEIKPISLWAAGRIAMYAGDGSERCVGCAEHAFYYVGQYGRLDDDGLPERFPVCSVAHAKRWMRWVWSKAFFEHWRDIA